ncbi:MAG: hypothetical protein WCK28_12885 [Burkholderiales bacterium]|jgi:hypothetical protein
MRWVKLGRVYCPDAVAPWMVSHAANPVAVRVDGDLHRIYFSTRDADNRSSIAWVEVDLRAPTRVERVCEAPALGPGELGTFDDSGCSIGSVLVEDGRWRVWYMGWNLGRTVPWRNAIGLATSDDGRRFERVSPAPIMDRSAEDPFTLSYPWVLHEADGYRMWYGSNLSWQREHGDLDHMLKAARSEDGVHWVRDGRVVIPSAPTGDRAFSRPCVVRDADRWRMWYSCRGPRYRIGHADSTDGEHWTRRDDEVGIDVTPGDWDGVETAYPTVFDHAGHRYLLYCGNGYGRTGFGIAVLEG